MRKQILEILNCMVRESREEINILRDSFPENDQRKGMLDEKLTVDEAADMLMYLFDAKTSTTPIVPLIGQGLFTPHRCPICGGNGKVMRGFYEQIGGMWSTTDITPELCRSCGGTGIVWG